MKYFFMILGAIVMIMSATIIPDPTLSTIYFFIFFPIGIIITWYGFKISKEEKQKQESISKTPVKEKETIWMEVKGTYLDFRQDILIQILDEEPDFAYGGDVKLIPEPDNEYDPNSIAVYFCTEEDDYKVGYIPRIFTHIVNLDDLLLVFGHIDFNEIKEEYTAIVKIVQYKK